MHFKVDLVVSSVTQVSDLGALILREGTGQLFFLLSCILELSLAVSPTSHADDRVWSELDGQLSSACLAERR